ncbi:glycoside hydrolase family 3 N-terminal domain-containing protein [Vibrio methylphosphonaticus]|uniref:glycoside hydrolase family 3 N-terminal domain-containing protein n=1 Tax=Vibrio methylphosphonaticus TaxID=2946866 RepID=UPI00202ABADE|nr:glycoside hydrolase family 3 N-terminal domain-containing protein [Vibrio methylphosphonaticus]MCL9774060.1 glycoside hydrolase family 3 C-terminal domain-containing protein [Vibrio methylphosphonaticus]
MAQPYQDTTLSIHQRVEDLLSRMTTEEKIGQLCQTPMLDYDDNREQYLYGVKKGSWGSRILADTAWAGNAPGESVDPKQLNEFQKVAVEQSRLGIPLIIARDVIYGQQTVLPIPLAQASSFNPDMIESAYRCIAKEAASLGIHWTFAPMLDIVRDPRWGRVIESAGEDPFLTSAMAKAVVKGFQGDDMADENSMVACAKHFIGYGAAEGGRDYDTTEITENTLHNVYLPPFKAAVEAGVATVMSGFNDLGGTPVSASKHLINGWLKQQQSFNGFVVSDWGSISDLEYFGVAKDAKESAKKALEAGVDMAMTNEAYQDFLPQLISSGQIDMATIDEATRRVLSIKFKAGLFEKPYVDEDRHKTILRHPEHVAKAQQLAEQSMVLLKNSGILPLASPSSLQSKLTIAVIGPHAHSKRQHLGSWCLDGRSQDVTSIYGGIQAYIEQNNLNVDLITEDASFTDEMVECAHRADLTILCTGESHRRTGEARNIAELTLPAGQEQLIQAIGETDTPLVVVQCTGRPVPSMATEQFADALLYAWQSGTETGHAVARLLFGAVSPSGCLPMSVPRSTGQIPIYYARKKLGKMRAFQEYQPYKDQKHTPLYAFGFGLTYGEFEYSNLELSHSELSLEDTLKVQVNVRNIGEHVATEVVQCYTRQIHATTSRPEKELKAFSRVDLRPGEAKTVCLEIPSHSLEYYGETQRLEATESRIELYVGSDSNASLEASFLLQASSSING